MTNREWMNSLSDEELAKEVTSPKRCKKRIGCAGSCVECTLDWLKKERVEDEQNTKCNRSDTVLA